MADSILVTGANRGIGLELVRQYLQAGWRVYACCRRPEQAADLNALAQKHSATLSVHPLDVTHPAQRAALVQAIEDDPIDILFNNAGIYGPQPQEYGSTDEQGWINTFCVNTIAPLKLMEALTENVANSRRKLMVGMTSKMGSMADNSSGGSYAYRSSKAALNAVLKSAAVDLKPRGITVLILHPGWVKTAMGGSGALTSAEECVVKLRRILENAKPEQSGKFFQADGTEVSW